MIKRQIKTNKSQVKNERKKKRGKERESEILKIEK